MRQLLVAVLFLAVISGCESVDVLRVSPGRLRPDEWPVQVYASEAEVGMPFIICALIYLGPGGELDNDKSPAAALEKAKWAARQLGGDAIILHPAEARDPRINAGRDANTIIMAIRFRE